MSHDIEAAWIASEIARYFKDNLSKCFSKPPNGSDVSTYAVRESRNKWPIADGVIVVEGTSSYALALEFKRENEGLHGTLMALGQAYAYVHKGFSAALIAIPSKYPTHDSPADYLSRVIDAVGSNNQIGVFSYTEPDPAQSTPFKNKLDCVRSIALDQTKTGQNRSNLENKTETQWAHVREGSSDPDAFFKYLQKAKLLDSSTARDPQPSIPNELAVAVNDLKQSNVDPVKYLSNSPGNSFSDIVWRHFWFSYVLTDQALPIWRKDNSGHYIVNNEPSRIVLPKGTGFKKFFGAKGDSVKNKIVERLNQNQIDERNAWKEYAKNIHKRAHSYREDIDSTLEHLGLLEADGKPSSLGYRFVDACERSGDANSGTPKNLLGRALLRNGQFGAFLHYVFRLSEEKFSVDPWSFTADDESDAKTFDRTGYLAWLEDELANKLKVMHKVSPRGGQARQPFQAELAILRNFEYVAGFRPGVGLVINWPKVQETFDRR